MRRKHVPMRTCVGCRTSAPKRELIRVVRSPEGEVGLDLTGKRPGRGVYIHPQEECLQKAIKTRQIQRALETAVDESLIQELTEVLLAQGQEQQES